MVSNLPGCKPQSAYPNADAARYDESRVFGRNRARSVAMPLDWSPFVELVRRHQRFLMTTHVRPDGDGLGSMLALDDVLRRQGKEVQLVISSPMPARYQFLDPAKRIQCFSPPAALLRR